MKKIKIYLSFVVAVCGVFFSSSLLTAAPVKIGMITTLSTGSGYLGEEVRDGFILAMEKEGGALGGIEIKLLVEDDNRKPQKGIEIAERFISRDKVDIVTGIIFSNVLNAVVPKVTRKGKIFISPNAGSSKFAGKGCDKNYFNVSWQNDGIPEAMGNYLTTKGKEDTYLLSVNYQAGKDMIAGFKRFYKGSVSGEVYVKLGQSDYAAEISNLRAAKPKGIFFFLPGGMGINFMKQFVQAGLHKEINVYGPAWSFDERILKAIGEVTVGFYNTTHWNQDFDNPSSRQFVHAYRKKHGKYPTVYASQGYDAALLIASALKTLNGDVSDTDSLREALRNADFESVRGNFMFGKNQHPVQDFYLRQVFKKADGSLTNKTIEKVFTNHVDAYAGDCEL
jgi:branched-chain amino acid transport system substrate-binding protein